MEAGILLACDMKITQIIVESIVKNISEKFVEGSLGNLYQGILALLSSFSS